MEAVPRMRDRMHVSRLYSSAQLCQGDVKQMQGVWRHVAEAVTLSRLAIKININICSIELKWDGKKLNYDMIKRWGEYE